MKRKTAATAPLSGNRSFAAGMNFYKLFWVFFWGCFAGVVVETIWCLLTRHTFESRLGVIYGPFNPVYGFGALLLTVCLRRLSGRRDLWIFLGSAILGGGFEFLCSLFQELAFGTVSWEYSHTQLNLAGRTNMMFSFFWGILGLLWVKDIYPLLSRKIERIPDKIGRPLTWVLAVFMVLNMAISALAVGRQSQRRSGIPPQTAFAQFLDNTYPDKLLEVIYPNMVVVEDALGK
ncbi:MAG: putative ABC transporter permease [Angelakisella sp.]